MSLLSCSPEYKPSRKNHLESRNTIAVRLWCSCIIITVHPMRVCCDARGEFEPRPEDRPVGRQRQLQPSMGLTMTLRRFTVFYFFAFSRYYAISERPRGSLLITWPRDSHVYETAEIKALFTPR